MDLNIKMISERLIQYKPHLIINDESSTVFKSIKLYGPNTEIFEPDFLYAGKLSSFPASVPANQCINFLCIADLQPNAALLQKQNINLVIIEENVELDLIFNQLQDFIYTCQAITRNSGRLLDSIIHGRGLQHIINIGYELLNNPIVVFDRKSNLMAHSANIETDDILNHELLTMGRFSKETLDYIFGIDPPYLADQRRHPFLLKNKKLKYDRIVNNIFLDNKVVAILAVWENDSPFREGDIELIAQLCDVISSEMQRSEFYKSLNRISYETVIGDILDGKIVPTKMSEQFMGSMGWELKRNNYLLVIDIGFYDKSYVSITRIREHVELMVRDCLTFIYNNYILVILQRDDENPLTESEERELLMFLGKNSLYAGVSNCFHDLADMPSCYRQSLKALELGLKLKSSKALFRYQSYQMFDLFDSCSSQDLMGFCHPLLIKILEYDNKNHTDYAKTLYAYLANGKDSLGTSKSLHIHRNTTIYRLERIRELFKIDLNDGDLLFHIFASFKILAYLGEINNEISG